MSVSPIGYRRYRLSPLDQPLDQLLIGPARQPRLVHPLFAGVVSQLRSMLRKRSAQRFLGLPWSGKVSPQRCSTSLVVFSVIELASLIYRKTTYNIAGRPK